MKKGYRARLAWLALSLGLVLFDALSKHWARTVLKSTDTMVLIPGVLGLHYAENTGAAFSAFSGATVLLGGISLIVCVVLVIWILKKPDAGWLLMTGLSLTLAGGAGNLIDRLVRGSVTDFFEFLFVRFAIFNVADICITAGVGLILLAVLFGGEKSARMEG